jgi:3-(3-hydroxy-phenyl)propionate hydroxylase
MRERPVVIVGAGPTGMTAAALLARRGVPVVVFEREADVLPIPRAVHLDEEVMRVFHDAGFGAEVAAVTAPIRGMLLVDRALGTLVSFAREGIGTHGFPRSSAFDQPELERAMRSALAREPLVSLRTGTSVEAVEPRGDAVLRVTARDARRGAIETLEAGAVLGCDGARSRTRTFVGADLEDLGFDARWLVVDVATPAPLGLYEGCLQVADPDRPTTYFHTGRGLHRWEIMLRAGETPAEMTREARVRELLAPWLGPATSTATIRRRAVYTFHSLIARGLRRGRVFLLGDAAHQTPPFIGQGMGAGVRDAANLAWKLAEVLQGRAREELLDTYEAERRPHVRSVVQQAVLLGRTMRTTLGGRLRDPVLRRLGAFGPIHDLFLRRAFPAYEAGPLIRPRGSGPAGGHAPRAPVEIDGRATHLDEVLGDGFALVVRAGAAQGGRGIVRVRRLGDACLDRAVVDRDGVLSAWLAELGAEAALVRPDRVVMASGRLAAAPRWIASLSRFSPRATCR